MTSAQETKNAVSFFTSLRRLGREIDQGVKEVHGQLDSRSLQAGDKRHLALKGLWDRKRDVDSLKMDARVLLKKMRHGGSEFEQVLQACLDVIDVQTRQLSNIQSHLMQYGFVPQPECEDDSEEMIQTEGTSAAEGESPATPPKQSADEQEIEKRCKLTPRLEDFGLSSYTLNLRHQPSKQADTFKIPAAVSSQSNMQAGNTAMHHDSIPTPFRNNGLTVTPSLFSSNRQFRDTDNRRAEEAFSLAYSPCITSRQGQVADSDLQPTEMGVAKMLDFSDSPTPPVLHTPGVKQIPHLKDAAVPPEGGKSNAARKLKLENCAAATHSPVPPILRTPGILQITRRPAAPQTPVGKAVVSHNDQLELPKTPDLTYSLKDLEDMTISFRNADLSSTFSERAMTTSDFNSSSSVPTGSFTQQGFQGQNIAPAQQRYEVTSTNISVSEPPLPNWTRDRFTTEPVELPISPELTMTYPSMSRNTATSRPALTIGCQRAGVGNHGRPVHVESRAQHKESYVQHNLSQLSDSAGFPSSYLGSRPTKLSGTNSQAAWFKENVISPAPCMPNLKTGKFDPEVHGSVLPDQPKLQRPLTDNNMDLPTPPKFMGSYHFMNSSD